MSLSGSESAELERLAALGWSTAAMHKTPEGFYAVGELVPVNYPEGGLAALDIDGGGGYWFDHRAREVIDAIAAVSDARVIWDVGAGSGAMSQRFAGSGYEVISVEPLSEGAAAIAGKHCSTVFCSSLEALGLPAHSIEIVGLFDVIEHLDDPDEMVHEVTRVLRPASIVVVTVPAYPALWSNSDEVAGHRRRYTRKSLDNFMAACGLRRMTSKYLFASLVPPALVLRTIPYRLGRRRTREEALAATSRRLAPNKRVDRAATRVLDAETAIARRVPLPFGLSVLGVYQTPQ